MLPKVERRALQARKQQCMSGQVSHDHHGDQLPVPQESNHVAHAEDKLNITTQMH